MDRNGSVIGFLLLLFMIILGLSDAFNSRKLVAIPDPNGSSNANKDSPSSPPPPDVKKPDLPSVEVPKSNDSLNTTPSNVESKGLNDTNTNNSSKTSSDLERNQGKNQDGKEPKTISGQSCKGLPICSDQGKSMIACIQDFVNGSNNLSLVVQNEKDVDLKVNIAFGTSVDTNLPIFEVPAHGTKKVNITLSGDKSNKVILNAGNGDCELQIGQPAPVNSSSNLKDANGLADSPAKPKDNNKHVESPAKPKEENSPSTDKKGDSPSKSNNTDDQSKSKDRNDPSKSKDEHNQSKSKDDNDQSKSKDTVPPLNPKTSVDTPISQNNFLDQLMFYSKQVTPIYGAYVAFVVALIIGVSWALCTFRKRRTRNEVPYQELEMGPTESSNAVNVETAEGWEHDWGDDDWDEDEAIRSPGGAIQAKSISSNGLTSRAGKKVGMLTGMIRSRENKEIQNMEVG